MLDTPRPVRPAEELDLARLERWMAERVPEVVPPLSVEQFPGGFSNLTYLLRDAAGRELVLRRPPVGASVRGGHDMAREHRLLARLAHLYPRAPRPIALAEEATVLGAPFYLMERVRGVIPRGARTLDPALDAALDETTMRRVGEALVDALAELHALDWAAAGLADLGHPEGYARRQITGWTQRWQAARTGEVPAMERVGAWLATELSRQLPDGDRTVSLIHNDFKLDNVVLDPLQLTRIAAVLDWEMATIGDARLDLGTSLAYWLDPDDPPALRALGVGSLTTRPGSLRRVEVLERYARRAGLDVGDGVFIFAYGLFKLAVILQQIHARWAKGLTRDPRFATLDQAVAACAAMAERAIRLGRIERLA